MLSAYIAYIIYILLFVLLIFIPRRLQPLQLVLVFTLLLVIWGGSSQNGADWIWYNKYYLAISQSDTFEAASQVSSFETGFVVLMYLCSKVGLEFQYFVYLCAAASSISWLYFVKNITPYVNVALVSLILFLIDGWTLYNEQLRQAVGISIGLIAFIQWQKGNTKASLLLLVSSVLFHRSTIVMLLFFALERYLKQHRDKWFSLGLSLKILFGVFAILFGVDFVVSSGFLSLFSGNPLVDKLIAYNVDESYGNTIFSLGMISYLLGLVVLIPSFKLVNSSNNKQLQLCWFITLLWCLVGPILRIQSIFIRFEHFFIIFIPVLLGLLWRLKQPIVNKVVLNGIIIIFVLSFTFRVLLQPSQLIWVRNYQNDFLNLVSGLENQDVDLRKIDICNNLKENNNNFCDWE